MYTLLLLVGIALLAWFWLDSLRAREIATGTMKEVCRRHGVQFLDDTVALARLGLRRDPVGQLRLRRTYRFDFTLTGVDRRAGTVVMVGSSLELMRMDLPERDSPAGETGQELGS
jgi:hypothetical protein